MGLRPLFILFLSTGNAARSLLAEAMLNTKGSERFMARSAGCSPLAAPHPETLDLLRQAKIGVTDLHTKDWGFFLNAPASQRPDVIVTLSEEARRLLPPLPGNPVIAHWVVENPLAALRADVREWKFRKCAATLERRIDALVKARPAPTSCELFLQLKDIGMVV